MLMIQSAKPTLDSRSTSDKLSGHVKMLSEPKIGGCRAYSQVGFKLDHQIGIEILSREFVFLKHIYCMVIKSFIGTK